MLPPPDPAGGGLGRARIASRGRVFFRVFFWRGGYSYIYKRISLRHNMIMIFSHVPEILHVGTKQAVTCCRVGVPELNPGELVMMVMVHVVRIVG